MFEKSSEGTKPICGVSIEFLVNSCRPRRWDGSSALSMTRRSSRMMANRLKYGGSNRSSSQGGQKS